MKIRKATNEDVSEICDLHQSSIRELGAAYYSPEVIATWSDLKPQGYIEAMEKGEHMFVAEIDDRIVGFGSVTPENSEVNAVYVSPESVRKGVGSAILLHLETYARDLGVNQLKLASSLAAVDFYAKHGYDKRESFCHEFRQTGVQCECVWMTKALDIQPLA